MTVPSALAPFSDLFQDRMLVRSFLDGLRPYYVYGGLLPAADEWRAHAGLTQTFTTDGYYDTRPVPTPTTVDPSTRKRRAEQFDMTLVSFQGSDDVDYTQAQNSLNDYAMNTYNRLAQQAAETVDGYFRGVITSAACAGWTVADGPQGPTNNLRVARLNGFTTALPPPSANSIRHSPVSGANPLAISVVTTTGVVTRNVIGFTADCQFAVDQGSGVPDLNGPGVLILDGAAITVNDRAPVIASNASTVHRSGSGTDYQNGSIDAVKAPLSYADLRIARTHLSNTSVRPSADYGGRYAAMLSPYALSGLRNEPEFQRLIQTRGIDELAMVEGIVGTVENVLLIENQRAPGVNSVIWQDAAQNKTPTVYGRESSYGLLNVSQDSLGIEVCQNNDASQPIDTTVLVGDGAFKRMRQPHPIVANIGALMTEVGIAGAVVENTYVTNDAVAIDVEGVTTILRAPLNKLADKASVAWQSKQSITVRSDQIGQGSRARYKRVVAIQSQSSAPAP